MNDSSSPGVIHEFGAFRLDARRRLLNSREDGRAVPVTSKAFDILLYLVEHAGEVIEKAALIRAAWPNVSVEENSLSQVISALRRTLGEDPSEHRYIVTAPGRGYRFIANVETVRPKRASPHATAATAAGPSSPGQRPRSLAVPGMRPSTASGRMRVTRR